MIARPLPFAYHITRTGRAVSNVPAAKGGRAPMIVGGTPAFAPPMPMAMREPGTNLGTFTHR